MHIEPFHLHEGVFAELRARLTRARFPSQVRGAGWIYGANLTDLRELVEYWLDAYDWRAQEAPLNRQPQYPAEVDGRCIHFVHARAARENALPWVMTHGWPGSFFEFYKGQPDEGEYIYRE